MSTAASVAASSAAAARRRLQQQEEEEMTTYHPQELSDDWEFKILRSMKAAFRHSERLHEILAEEGRAGWVLVEKFDDGRIRLKRPSRARELDIKLDFDPYRTYIGPSENRVALTGAAAVFGIMFAVLLVVVVVAKMNDRPPPALAPPLPVEVQR